MSSFDINRTVDEVTFHNWKEMVAATANPEDKYTVQTLLHLLCHEIRCLYDVPDRSALIDSAQGKCDDLLLNYQTLRDLREITPDCFALLCEGIVSVRKQLEGLRRTAKAKVYAETD